MKLAVASNGNICSEHFGHCEGFHIYEIKNNNIINKTFLKSPIHTPTALPLFLVEQKIDTIVATGMGMGAQKIFKENNIEIIVGASGDVDDLANQYILKNLTSDNSICTNHEYEEN